MRKGLFLGLWIGLLLVVGCSHDFAAKTNDDFLQQIYSRYPELKEKSYEIETVKRVIDGDTFETASGHKVRLIGVNTPEISGAGEYYGQEASDYSRNQLLDRTVYLFQDVSITDRYNRWLRYVFIEGEEQMFNETLVREGYANTMTIAPDVMFASQFLTLEQQSRQQNKGLWNKEQETPTVKQETPTVVANNHRCDEPMIKGNINAKDEKIYHVPGGRYYEQTIAEALFCTEQEAMDAGFRASKY